MSIYLLESIYAPLQWRKYVDSYLSTKMELRINEINMQIPKAMEANRGSIFVPALMKIGSTFIKITVIPQRCCSILKITTITNALLLLETTNKSRKFPFSWDSLLTAESMDRSSSIKSEVSLNFLKKLTKLQLLQLQEWNEMKNYLRDLQAASLSCFSNRK